MEQDTQVLPDIPDEVPVGDYARYWLPGWLYDVLKWAAMLAVPALAAAYSGLAAVWGWPFAGEVAQTAALVSTGIGALIGASEITKRKGA